MKVFDNLLSCAGVIFRCTNDIARYSTYKEMKSQEHLLI